MVLSDLEKSKVRILIEYNKRADYMANLAASDDFARSEIAKCTPGIIAILNTSIPAISNNIDALNLELSLKQVQFSTLQNND